MSRIIHRHGETCCRALTRKVIDECISDLMAGSLSSVCVTFLSFCSGHVVVASVCPCSVHALLHLTTSFGSRKQVTTSLPSFHVYLGCTQKTMRNKQRHCGQLQNHVRIQNFRRSNGKTTKLGNAEQLYVVFRYGRSAKKCVERHCELANKSTQQLYKVSTPCLDDHQFMEEELKFVGNLIVQSMLSNCSEMSVVGTQWWT